MAMINAMALLNKETDNAHFIEFKVATVFPHPLNSFYFCKF